MFPVAFAGVIFRERFDGGLVCRAELVGLVEDFDGGVELVFDFVAEDACDLIELIRLEFRRVDELERSCKCV